MDDFPKNARLLHEFVDHHAAIRPEHPAIDDGNRLLSYGSLAARMTGIASALRRASVARGDRVCILIDNGIEACAAIVGTLRAEGCFVALNPSYPPQRLAEVIVEAGAAAIITTPAWADLIVAVKNQQPETAVLPVLLLDDASDRRSMQPLHNAFQNVFVEADFPTSEPVSPSTAIEEDLAYILFTSGSTGRPKGVMVSHRAIRSTIEWGVAHFNIVPEDRLSNHSRLSFDVSLFDIFCSFFAGATLCPLTRPGDCAFPGEFIRRMGITFWFSVPSVIAMMLKARQLAAGPFETLRAALFAGEPLAPDLVAEWRRLQPQTPIYNLYGPTEAAIVVTCHNIGVDSPFDPEASVPIGRDTRDVEILILDADADVVIGIGEVGRLMICGTQLAEGYWRQPEMTGQAFKPHCLKRGTTARMYESGDLAYRDDAGIIHFIGRVDDQIKIRGYRVELGDVETALLACAGVREGAAVTEGDGETKTIVGIVGRADGIPTEDKILAQMSERLPPYMVPSRIVYLQELPRNPNGKIDRKALVDRFVVLSADV